MRTTFSDKLFIQPISSFKPGDLAAIIRRSYAALVEGWPEPWAAEAAKWDDFDRQAFGHPETIGRCVFVTSLADKTGRVRTPVGLASYDPRQADCGVIGQNCVLPEFRGRGFGGDQILEIFGRFEERGTSRVRVTTSEHPFFAPAVRMYAGLGFREIRRASGGPDPRYGLIELETRLLL